MFTNVKHVCLIINTPNLTLPGHLLIPYVMCEGTPAHHFKSWIIPISPPLPLLCRGSSYTSGECVSKLFLVTSSAWRHAKRKSSASLSQRKEKRGGKWGGVYNSKSQPTLVQTGSCPLPLLLSCLFSCSFPLVFSLHLIASLFFLPLLFWSSFPFLPNFFLFSYVLYSPLFFLDFLLFHRCLVVC